MVEPRDDNDSTKFIGMKIRVRERERERSCVGTTVNSDYRKMGKGGK